MKRLITLAAAGALKVLVDRIHAARQRRAMDGFDLCEFCHGGPGEFFVDVTPRHRHVTVRLACTWCATEATRAGAVVLMGNDGRPVTHGR